MPVLTGEAETFTRAIFRFKEDACYTQKRLKSENCCYQRTFPSYKGPRVATPKTRSPAPHPVDRRPHTRWITHRARTSIPASSVKSAPLSNPEGPRRGCAAGQHAQHFGPFIPRCLAYTMSHGNLGTSTGPCIPVCRYWWYGTCPCFATTSFLLPLLSRDQAEKAITTT